MKFIRRHDLTPHTRIEMVRLAWLNQGIYGKMTQIAQEYQISRTWLYQLIWAANLQLETLFGDQKPHAQESPILFEPFILLLRLEGKCSLDIIGDSVYSAHAELRQIKRQTSRIFGCDRVNAGRVRVLVTHVPGRI
jgi:hypothetical protein